MSTNFADSEVDGPEEAPLLETSPLSLQIKGSTDSVTLQTDEAVAELEHQIKKLNVSQPQSSPTFARVVPAQPDSPSRQVRPPRVSL